MTHSPEPVVLEVESATAWIHLNRAHSANALSHAFVLALLETFHRAQAMPGVQTIGFCSALADFSTGMDLSGLASETDESLRARFEAIEDLLAAVWSSPCRTIARVQGRAWGAAADLVVACDHRQITPDASFRFPGAQFGLVLGTRRLAQRVGRDRARDLVLTGRTVNAEQAMAMGLATAMELPWPSLDAVLISGETQRMVQAVTQDSSGTDAEGLGRDRSALRLSMAGDLHARLTAYRERVVRRT
jgi:enoyl-CoA hydratase/carnithine racemase